MSYAMRFECDAPDCGRHFWTSPGEAITSDRVRVPVSRKQPLGAHVLGVLISGSAVLPRDWHVVTDREGTTRQFVLCSDHTDWRP